MVVSVVGLPDNSVKLYSTSLDQRVHNMGLNIKYDFNFKILVNVQE